MYDDGGLCKGCVWAVLWIGSAASSRATEGNKQIDLKHTLQGERRDWIAWQRDRRVDY
jgi:hypothetical protein